MEQKSVTQALQEKFGENILDVQQQFGDDIVIFERSALRDIVAYLYAKPFEYTMLLDLTCVDYMGETPRFEMVYLFLSMKDNHRLRMKTRLPDENLSVDSLTSIWKNADWLEREVYDMFGIHFNDHPYLTRIFMYDGFEGHPLRKDYPLRKRQPRIKMRK